MDFLRITEVYSLPLKHYNCLPAPQGAPLAVKGSSEIKYEAAARCLAVHSLKSTSSLFCAFCYCNIKLTVSAPPISPVARRDWQRLAGSRGWRCRRAGKGQGQGQCPGDPQPTLPHFPAVMRCLGVPSRVVTNYNSAHDTNGNLVIDRYMNETGVEERRSKDMIW